MERKLIRFRICFDKLVFNATHNRFSIETHENAFFMDHYQVTDAIINNLCLHLQTNSNESIEAVCQVRQWVSVSRRWLFLWKISYITQSKAKVELYISMIAWSFFRFSFACLAILCHNRGKRVTRAEKCEETQNSLWEILWKFYRVCGKFTNFGSVTWSANFVVYTPLSL